MQSQGRFTEDQVTAFMAKRKETKKPAWSLATEMGDLSKAEADNLEKKHNLTILSLINNQEQTHFTFTPRESNLSVGPFVGGFELFLHATSNITESDFNAICSGYDRSSQIKLDSKFAATADSQPFDPEQKGFFTVIRTNDSIEEIYSSSFLGEQKILALLATYWLLGWATIESQDQAIKRQHEQSLSEKDRKLRDQMNQVFLELDQSNYYAWLDVTITSSCEEIDKAAQSRMEQFALPVVDRLFLLDEAKIPDLLLKKLAEARKILTDPAKRSEYDQKMEQGHVGSFIDDSQAVQEEEALRRAREALSQGETQQALASIEALQPSLQASVSIAVLYSDTLAKSDLAKNPATCKKSGDRSETGYVEKPGST